MTRYLVGESGPELFDPRAAAAVLVMCCPWLFRPPVPVEGGEA